MIQTKWNEKHKLIFFSGMNEMKEHKKFHTNSNEIFENLIEKCDVKIS